MPPSSMLLTLLLVALLGSSSLALPSSCKCFHGDYCFPRGFEWARFNTSINGRLITPHPAAFACHDPNYDEKACNEAKSNWSDSLWRSQQPGALEFSQYEAFGNHSCFVGTTRETPCHQGSVPVYAVNVSGPSDVEASVNFARSRNLRLVIKNTGHDYFGKSTGRGALSLWMHNLKKIRFLRYYTCTGSGSPAVQVGAGVQWRDLYAAATEQGVVLVGPTSASVGAAGGWWQGAGQGSLSPRYGLGADNVLEIELVTASGEHIIANECYNQDLFWAMRGGGGGTFGVVLSVTYATHPAPTKVLATSISIASSNTSSFQELLTVFATLHPNLTDLGWSGTFVLTPNSMFISYIALDKDTSFVNATLSPLFNFVRVHPDLRLALSVAATYPTFEEFFSGHLCAITGNNMDNGKCVDRTGVNRALGSRLIPRSKLEQNPELVGEMLINVLNSTGYSKRILGMAVAGGAVSEPKSANAVNPAWRNAIWHLIVSADWEDGASCEERQDKAESLTAVTKIMEDATPGSGAYINEANYNQPQWQSTFFGDHYIALKAIKDLRDPTGLFVCRHCVGSEEWTDDFKCPRVD